MSILIENITKRFGENTVLDNINLEIKTGSLVALLGGSGSGKSTLLRVVAGFEQPNTGRVWLHGKDSTNLSIQEKEIGFVFQAYALFQHLTVYENIAFGISGNRPIMPHASLLYNKQLTSFSPRTLLDQVFETSEIKVRVINQFFNNMFWPWTWPKAIVKAIFTRWQKGSRYAPLHYLLKTSHTNQTPIAFSVTKATKQANALPSLRKSKAGFLATRVTPIRNFFTKVSPTSNQKKHLHKQKLTEITKYQQQKPERLRLNLIKKNNRYFQAAKEYESHFRGVEELLRLVGLEELAQRYPSQLSGGQCQRVALARALAVQPKVLLLDEPFGALDTKVRKNLRRWLRQLHEKVGVTTLFVTHDHQEAMEVANEIVVLEKGRVKHSLNSPQKIYNRLANLSPKF